MLRGDNLHKDIEETLDGKKLSLVLDTVARPQAGGVSGSSDALKNTSKGERT
jgi:hypothetical protein